MQPDRQGLFILSANSCLWIVNSCFLGYSHCWGILKATLYLNSFQGLER